MSTLSQALEGLFAFLEARGQVPPVTRGLVIVEIPSGTPIDERGRFRVRSDQLLEEALYEKRFDELVGAGLPWINLSCYGVWNDMLVVAVELPRPGTTLAGRTSVNHSGPTSSTRMHGWDAGEVLKIEVERDD
jgi:hypothetical protein